MKSLIPASKLLLITPFLYPALSPALVLASPSIALTGQELFQAAALSPEEAQGLTFLREEEKLARDVYIQLFSAWNLDVFSNIYQSEQKHMDSVKTLLDRYNLPDPAVSEVGSFTNPQLQALYDSLVARGEQSEIEALRVGAYIEELDIRDLANLRATTTNPDILRVIDQLTKGSRNHLRAFVKQIELRGVVYEAQILPESQVDAIVDSPTERGRA